MPSYIESLTDFSLYLQQILSNGELPQNRKSELHSLRRWLDAFSTLKTNEQIAARSKWKPFVFSAFLFKQMTVVKISKFLSFIHNITFRAETLPGPNKLHPSCKSLKSATEK